MTAPEGAPLGRSRSWPQRLLIGFNVMLLVVCLTGAGGLGYFYYQFGKLPTIDVGDGVLEEEPPPAEPQNFLLVGSDSRDFVEPGTEDQRTFGDATDTGAARADTIILVRVDPQTTRAAMVSFPRDLWLPIAPDGASERINTAFEGGPGQLIETITSNFQIPIHHYAQVDFQGFKGLVDAVGGVTVFLASPVRDRDASGRNLTGLNILDTGCVELHGDQALAYVRSRHLQYQENGTWKRDPSGDIGRIARQQDFIRRAMRDALSKGLMNPSRLNRLMNVAVNNITRDSDLDLKDVVNLGKNFRSLSPETLQQFSLPVTNARIDGKAVLRIEEEDRGEAEAIFEVFRGTPPAPAENVQPAAVTVRVLNGSGQAGQAAEVTAALQQAQFGIAAPGNASRVTRTTIRYGTDQQAKAQLLARYLASGADLVPSPDLQSVDVVLVTGTDFDGILNTPKPLPPEGTTVSPPPNTPRSAAPEC